MKKKPERRYDDDWRAAVHAEAQAFLAKVKARDEAARILREQQKQAQQERREVIR
jgi:hypothetical protein